MSPFTDYIEDMGRWEEWQREYRFGVLLLFPPDPPLTAANCLRAEYDPPSQATCDAHISLTVPLPRPMDDSHWRELEAIAAAIDPIDIRYGPLMNFLPHPGVCLTIEPRDRLDRLRIALESATIFRDASPRRHPFVPHMTIAEFITVERTLELMENLKEIAPSGRYLCTGVSYAVPDAAFHFAERRWLRLGNASHGGIASDHRS
jgi:hypothetical protein